MLEEKRGALSETGVFGGAATERLIVGGAGCGDGTTSGATGLRIQPDAIHREYPMAQ